VNKGDFSVIPVCMRREVEEEGKRETEREKERDACCEPDDLPAACCCPIINRLLVSSSAWR